MIPCADGVDVVDALEHVAGDEQRPNGCERGEEDQRDRQRPNHHPFDPGAVAEIVADQEQETGRQLVDADERLADPVARAVGAVVDDDESAPLKDFQRNLLNIAGERFAGGIGQQIERRAGLALARLDRRVEADQPVVVVGVPQPLGFGVDRSGDFLVDDRDDLPGDDREHDPRANRADGQDCQRKSKGGGAEEFSERRHVSCTRRRERC